MIQIDKCDLTWVHDSLVDEFSEPLQNNLIAFQDTQFFWEFADNISPSELNRFIKYDTLCDKVGFGTLKI